MYSTVTQLPQVWCLCMTVVLCMHRSNKRMLSIAVLITTLAWYRCAAGMTHLIFPYTPCVEDGSEMIHIMMKRTWLSPM